MSKKQKALKVISWVLIVFSVLGVVSGIAFSAVAMGNIAESPAIQAQIEASSGSDDLIVNGELAVLVLGLVSVIFGIYFLVTGIFARIGAKNPGRIMPFLILSVAGMVAGFTDILTLVNGKWADPGSVISALISIAIPAACFYLAHGIRKEGLDLNHGELPGKDGSEFPNGFNPKKLGFMRLLQVFFVFNICLSIFSLTMLVKGNYELNFAQLLDLLNVILDAVLFWFIFKRYAATRKFAIGISLFNIIIGTGFNLIYGEFNLSNQIGLCMGDIVILTYFLTSRRAKAILTNPFSVEHIRKEVDEEERTFWRPKTWAFWRSVIIYFCIFCIVGHWMEAAFCLLIKYGIVPGIYDPNSQIWSDWLYPFPVYGFGTVACILVLYPIKNFLQRKIPNAWGPVVVSFIINTLVCSAIELTLGLLQNQPVDGVYPLWDYSNMFCNFMGQICLQNSLAFGGVATLMTWVVYPSLEKLMKKLPSNVANILFIVVVVFFSICMSLYCIKLTMPEEITTAGAAYLD